MRNKKHSDQEDSPIMFFLMVVMLFVYATVAYPLERLRKR